MANEQENKVQELTAPEHKEKKPFYSTVAGTVTGQIGGLFTGAVVGGAIWAAIAAVAATGLAVATTFIPGAGDVFNNIFHFGTDFGSFTAGAQTIGTAAGIGALAGGIGGAAAHAGIGAISGAVAGFINTRNLEHSEVAQAQEKQLEYARGIMQGATLAQMGSMQEQLDTGTKWQETVGKKNRPELYADKVAQDRAMTQLASMEPKGFA